MNYHNEIPSRSFIKSQCEKFLSGSKIQGEEIRERGGHRLIYKSSLHSSNGNDSNGRGRWYRGIGKADH